MAGAKTEGAAPKRGAKGGQRRETPAPAEVQIGGAQQQAAAVAVVSAVSADPLVVLASVIAGARGEAAAIEAIDRAELDQLLDVLPRLGPQDGRGRVEDEIARRRRVVAVEAGVRSQEEREEGLVAVRKAFLPCPMSETRLVKIRAQFAEAAWEISQAEEAEAARAAQAKASIKAAKEDIKWLAQAAGTGLEDHEVQVEERLETNEKGEKLVGCYRLDTGERYSTRYASAEDIDAAAQVRLRWGRP